MILKVLDSIPGQTFAGSELTISDSASTDRTAAIGNALLKETATSVIAGIMRTFEVPSNYYPYLALNGNQEVRYESGNSRRRRRFPAG